ncbi:MAG: hypothetical protein ACREIW_10865, partial [Chthoniobacterales bacterium]
MRLISDIAAMGWNVSMLLLLVKATLILFAALAITIAMQSASAGSRHLVWLITLGALLLVPALATFTPLRLEILPPPAQSALHQSGDTHQSPFASAQISGAKLPIVASTSATQAPALPSAPITS